MKRKIKAKVPCNIAVSLGTIVVSTVPHFTLKKKVACAVYNKHSEQSSILSQSQQIEH